MMHFLQVLPLALSVSAFLVPAEINNPFEVIKHLPDYAKAEDVRLECDGGCPLIASAHTADSSHSVLGVKLAIQDGVVTFNQAPIWPPASSEPLSVGIIPEKADGPIASDPISSSIEYKPVEILSDTHTSMKIHPVIIDILAIREKVVHVESLEVRIAETEAGLGLLPSRIRAYVASPYIDSCTNVWCRVKGAVAQKFNEWKEAASRKMQGFRGGCAGRKGGHGHKGMPLRGGPAKFGPGSTLHPEGGFRGQHHGPHPHGPHGHHRHSLLAHLFRTFVVGAIAGSILGMVCFIFVQAIRRIRGTQQTEYLVVEQVEAEEGRASMEGPPKYEEVYREAQNASEDEKKELLQ